MSTTARKIIEAAMARRTANDPDTLATKNEMISQISRFVMQVYTRVAKVNRRYFGKSASVEPENDEWARPEDAVAIFWIVTDGAAGTGATRAITETGKRVHLVPFGDREGEQAPAIYPMGRAFLTSGRTGDTPDPNSGDNGDKLKFFYGMQHPALDPSKDWEHADNTLDATWPSRYDDILVCRLARYLNVKAGRTAAELTAYDEEYKELMELLLAEAAMDNDRMSQRFDTE